MVNNFTWSFPTEIVFGSGVENKVGSYCRKFGNKVLLVYGGGSYINESGLMDRILDSLIKAGVEYDEITGVQPNPQVDKVRLGIKKYRDSKCKLILAIGGGSSIDTAKAIAAGVNYEGDVWDLFTGIGEVENPEPVGAVVTIAASGSEGSIGTVIGNPETKEKFDILHPGLRPKFAIMNPELTLSVPAFQTASGCTDILSHAMERYFTDTKGVELTDRLGEGLMKTVINNALILNEDPNNIVARSQIMWAATLAHNGLLEGGRNGSWASHMIGTELSAIYDITHGATLSVILPAWMKFVYKSDVLRFARFANKVMDVEYDINNLERTALKGIKRLEAFFKEISMPTSLEEVGVHDEREFKSMAKQATRFGKIGSIKKLDEKDIIEILLLAGGEK